MKSHDKKKECSKIIFDFMSFLTKENEKKNSTSNFIETNSRSVEQIQFHLEK